MTSTRRLSMLPQPPSAEDGLTELTHRRARHRFWNNPLFQAMSAGALTLEDLRYVFSQYFFYSKSFTRFVAGLLANCDNDLVRSRISENLWEEVGGTGPDRGHAQLFRSFLKQGLSLDPETLKDEVHTRHFVDEYLAYCLASGPLEGCAFLALGTERIVAATYEVFIPALRKVGLGDDDLKFFAIHRARSELHADTLERMMCSYAEREDWFDVCESAMNHALELRARFFEGIFAGLQARRVGPVVSKIQARKSLSVDRSPETPTVLRCDEPGTALYANEIERLSIKFTVDRLPFEAEVLDPRVVRIPPGKCNENHRHAHETIFYIIAGTGQVVVAETTTDVRPGDVVFVPRWAMHQSRNTGDVEMTILAITDFGLTGRVFVGDYEKTARNRTGKPG